MHVCTHTPWLHTRIHTHAHTYTRAYIHMQCYYTQAHTSFHTYTQVCNCISSTIALYNLRAQFLPLSTWTVVGYLTLPFDTTFNTSLFPPPPLPLKGLVSRGTTGQSPSLAAGAVAHTNAVTQSEPNSPRNSRPGSPQKFLPTARSSGNLLSASDDRTRQLSDAGTADLPPPFVGKGRHKCPRCYRRFESKAELEDHKIRCLI